MIRVIIISICICFIYSTSFALSEQAHKKFLRESKNYYDADTELGNVWKELKSQLSKDEYQIVLDDQRNWLKLKRDEEANKLFNSLSVADAYAEVTKKRVLYLKQQLEHNNFSNSGKESVNRHNYDFSGCYKSIAGSTYKTIIKSKNDKYRVFTTAYYGKYANRRDYYAEAHLDDDKLVVDASNGENIISYYRFIKGDNKIIVYEEFDKSKNKIISATDDDGKYEGDFELSGLNKQIMEREFAKKFDKEYYYAEGGKYVSKIEFSLEDGMLYLNFTDLSNSKNSYALCDKIYNNYAICRDNNGVSIVVTNTKNELMAEIFYDDVNDSEAFSGFYKEKKYLAHDILREDNYIKIITDSWYRDFPPERGYQNIGTAYSNFFGNSSKWYLEKKESNKAVVSFDSVLIVGGTRKLFKQTFYLETEDGDAWKWETRGQSMTINGVPVSPKEFNDYLYSIFLASRK